MSLNLVSNKVVTYSDKNGSSSILQEISLSGKFASDILPSGRPRYSQIRRLSSGFALPLKSFRSFIVASPFQEVAV